MNTWDEAEYRAFFRGVNGFAPYDFQVDVARRLIGGENVAVRAPTGSGKTAMVLTPFLYPGWVRRPGRLLYALPLRTLAQSIFRTAQGLAEKAGFDPKAFVTLQTGEDPGDPFFTGGRIVVATYDQILSGLLDAPYGLPGKLHNVNAAAVAGALVVFDEFHLMENRRAFLTGVAGLAMFRGLTQSVWMTATATMASTDLLGQALQCELPTFRPGEMESLPVVATVQRTLVWEDAPITADAVLRYPEGRSIVMVNTVDRAQALFCELEKEIAGRGLDVPLFLLHARFFKQDRAEKEQEVQHIFGRKGKGPAILIATQVLEAGIDVTSDHLHTELCPMNALVQRAGRCARYEHQIGVVHAYPLPADARSWLPYGTVAGPTKELVATGDLLTQQAAAAEDTEKQDQVGVKLTPGRVAGWVQTVHGDADAAELAGGWADQFEKVRQAIHTSAILRAPAGVGDLIRDDDGQTVRVVLARAENLPDSPARRDGIAVRRYRLRDFVRTEGEPVAWVWQADADEPWQPLRQPTQLKTAYAACLAPTVARYTRELGLQLALAGDAESPDRVPPKRPGHRPLARERWTAHAGAVAREAERRVHDDSGGGWLVEHFAQRYGLDVDDLVAAARSSGLLHDLGKLQIGWQSFAEAAQRQRDPAYRHLDALAHTDYDPESPQDRARERELARRFKRPPHAAASAFYATRLLIGLLSSGRGSRGALSPRLVAACAAAILAHHGGWLGGGATSSERIQPLWRGAVGAVHEITGIEDVEQVLRRAEAERERPGLAQLEVVLKRVADADELAEWWPLVAYLTRTLRLADQRATREGGGDGS